MADEQDYVAVISMRILLVKHDIVEVTDDVLAASQRVLTSLHSKDKKAAAEYWCRLSLRCRELDSQLELDTSMDLASQPAWTRYCKECINFAVLRGILLDEPTGVIRYTGSMFRASEEKIRHEFRQVKEEDTYPLQLDHILGRSFYKRHTELQRTGKEVIDSFLAFYASMEEKLKSGEVVLEYYRLLAKCKEMDTAVHESWQHHRKKYKQWKEFCDTCYLADMHHKFLSKQYKFSGERSKSSSSRCPKQEVTQAETVPPSQGWSCMIRDRLAFVREEAARNLEDHTEYSVSEEGSSTPTQVEDDTDSDEDGTDSDENGTESDDSNYQYCYTCLVGDKLAYVVDEETMDLAGKDSKTWEPQPRNFIVCQLQSHHELEFDMSLVLADHKAFFRMSVEDITKIQDETHSALLEMFGSDDRGLLERLYKAYVEHISETDTEKLRCQAEIGIAGAKKKQQTYVRDSISMLWFRQFLYGTPFPIILTSDMLQDVKPYLDKYGIQMLKTDK